VKHGDQHGRFDLDDGYENLAIDEARDGLTIDDIDRRSSDVARKEQHGREHEPETHNGSLSR